MGATLWELPSVSRPKAAVLVRRSRGRLAQHPTESMLRRGSRGHSHQHEGTRRRCGIARSGVAWESLDVRPKIDHTGRGASRGASRSRWRHVTTPPSFTAGVE